jgi:cytochrome c6
MARLFAATLMFAAIAVPALKAQTPSEALYKSKCAACHAPDGSGDTAAGRKLEVKDFRTPAVMKESDEVLLGIIVKGQNKMPSYKGKLSADQLKSLVAYVRELGKEK